MSSMLPSRFKITKKFSPKNKKEQSKPFSPMGRNMRSLSTIQKVNSKGHLPAFRGVSVKSALEQTEMRSTFIDDEPKLKTDRIERKVNHKFEDKATQEIFHDYFQIVNKHKYIHQAYNQI